MTRSRGRTVNARFDLDKNYRNTREIMRVAAEFVSPNAEQTDPEASLQIVCQTLTSHYAPARLLRRGRRQVSKMN